jgi:hypothetical protein
MLRNPHTLARSTAFHPQRLASASGTHSWPGAGPGPDVGLGLTPASVPAATFSNAHFGWIVLGILVLALLP